APTPAGWKPAVHLSTPVPHDGDASRSRTELDVVCSHVPCRPAHASSLRGQGSNLRDLVNGQAWLPLHHLGLAGTVTGDRTRPSGMRLQRRLQLTLTACAE